MSEASFIQKNYMKMTKKSVSQNGYLSTLDSTGTMILVKSKVKPRIQTPIVLILSHIYNFFHLLDNIVYTYELKKQKPYIFSYKLQNMKIPYN